MVQGLSVHLSLKVIEMNDIGKMPSYPFLTYDFTDLGGPENSGLPVVTIEGSKRVTRETELFDVSFLSYAASKAESIENALRARDWLLTTGKILLSSIGVIVVTVGQITNRDIQIGPEWERRHGFDVEFRITNIIETEAEVIEKVTVKEMN